jgi:uncharacterized protein (DUF1330 family)
MAERRLLCRDGRHRPKAGAYVYFDARSGSAADPRRGAADIGEHCPSCRSCCASHNARRERYDEAAPAFRKSLGGWKTMAKAYWVVCYRSISDPTARENYSKLGAPAVLAAGGRFLTRGIPAKTYEHGIKERTVVIEFDSVAQAIAAHDSPAYQAALAALGNGAERDLRIVEGVDG